MTQSRMPGGIPYIVSNEAAERFSYYGMRAILVIFMTKYLLDSAGNPDYMTPEQAKTWYHTFTSAVYFFPIIGALVSDIFWGKYKTILTLSIVYCLGHLTLALLETRTGLAIGLGLIAIGSGGIKPCVSAHVGDQFDESNKHLLERAFSLFYMAINFGSLISIGLTPWLLDRYSPGLAFGVPGILMFLATVAFWMGRHKFVHVPPVPAKKFFKDVFSPEGLKAIVSLCVIYIFVAVFWCLYDQTGSAWVLQAENLNRNVDLSFGLFNAEWLKFEVLSAQIQVINPLLILTFVPIFSYVIYPFMGRFFEVTAIRKIGIGFVVTAASFALTAYVQSMIDAGQTPSMLWQIAAIAIVTAGEVMVSITALEFSYTQAPNSMKSLIMGLFLMSVSFGNMITAAVNYVIQNPDGSSKFTGVEYYMFFTWLMLGTTVVYAVVSKFYQEKTYVQDAREKGPATA